MMDPGGITFAEFIMSLGANAAAMLGADDAERVIGHVDLVQVAQHIDILRMLKLKTEGNLEEEEGRLLETLIYDLQMRYLEISKKQ